MGHFRNPSDSETKTSFLQRAAQNRFFSGRTTTTIHGPDAAADTCNLGTVERMLWHAGQGGSHTAGHLRNVSEEGDAVRLLHRPRWS
jgi:hypothetical protein